MRILRQQLVNLFYDLLSFKKFVSEVTVIKSQLALSSDQVVQILFKVIQFPGRSK